MSFFEKQFGATNVYQHPSSGLLVDFSSFLDTLKKAALPTDTVRFRKGNVERIVNGYKNGMLLLDNGENAPRKQWITAAGILKYVFKHSSDIAMCSALAEEVQDIICQHKATQQGGLDQDHVEESASPGSILELYKIISHLSLRGDGLDTFYNGFFTADETILPTLYTVHKDHFTFDEWKKVMYFEHHYALRYGNDPQETSDVELEMRTKYYNLLCETKKMKEELYTVNRRTIKSRNQRKDSSEERMTTQMKGEYIHVYDCLDRQLHTEVKKYTQDVGDIITIPSSRSNHVSLSFTMDKSTLEELSDVHSIVSSYLIKKHNLCLDKIFVIGTKTCDCYYRKELKGYARFTIYDDIITAKIKPIMTYPAVTPMESDSEGMQDDLAPAKCEACFPMSPPRPLNISNFALLQEWVMDVPLTVQLLLKSSINKRYLRESTDKSRFLQPKVMKLYTCYDTMLNALNHKYIGVLQQANTLELIMHSKCLKTVFQVASGSGIAMSLSSAARYLESNSIDDILYYNTYMKGHPLTYKCKGLEVTVDICLRECIVILMVDNLVRLKYRDDPNPGESRSKQMNTLPITLQGIPLDSDEVASWHLPICDGSSQCQCKESGQISSDELVPLMVTLLPDEEAASKKFSQLCTWGYPGLWKQLLEGEFLQKIDIAVHSVSPLKVASNNCDPADLNTPQVSPPTASALIWEDNEANVEAGQVHHSPLPAVLQRTPISVSKRYSRVASASCSTPIDNKSPSQQPRPFVFNTMSPLQPKHLAYTDAALELDQYEAEEGSTESVTPHPDDTNCLASVIADAIRDGYDLRSEHVGEMNLFNYPEEQVQCTVSDFQEDQGDRPLESFSVPERFGFSKYVCPYLLTRHPPPATGKDDDPDKLREILDDLLLKMGHHEVDGSKERIIFGPDHKIGKNLLSLRNHADKYSVFLPEFPLLHVRKHKITILFSAYKDAGLIQLLRYMRDDEEDDWRKLLSAVHIEMATRHIRRLSASFNIAFLITFIQSLPEDQRELLQKSLEKEETSQIDEKWGLMYEEFIQKGCLQNATFCLHVEMMKHLGDVVAVSLAERLGGPDGYNLLLSSLKSSLLFSFLNGAVSYAPYTMQLLLEHYKASPFHKAMKMALYSTPRPGSTVNFSGDTKREMDHLDILKGFRSGSTLTSVSKRMALVDSFQEVHKHYNLGYGLSEEKTDKLGWELNATDWNHILPTVAVILRRGGISMEPSEVPRNVYAKEAVSLDPIILDSVSAPVGLYLLQRSACKLGLLGLTVSDIPEPESMAGPKHLVKKVASTKATTIRRTAIKTVNVRLNKSVEELAEEKRQKGISKDMKQIQRISSNMNMCQALVHPDCSKPKVNKSQTMPPALERYVHHAMEVLHEEDLDHPITLNTSLSLLMSPSARLTVKVAIIEFAGVKYKVKASTPSGKSYLEGAQNDVLLKYLNYLPSLQCMVICEKYEFTPDVLKSATREQRSMKGASVAHLKTGEEILCESTFSKDAIISTYEGKVMISNYLAENISDLNLHKDVELIVDSGLRTIDCICTTNTCISSCQKFAVPLKCTFSVENGFEKKEDVEGVKQRKGEGEMSQVDWLISSIESLRSGNSVVSIVSSGDIDAVVLHLMTVALRWPRDNDGRFLNHVYVILCKPGERFDIYCITKILNIIERATGDPSIGVKVAVGLCIGGNDFLPKYNFYGNHSKVLKLLTSNQRFLDNLVKISPDGMVTLDKDEYQEFVKQLYAPKQEATTQSFEEVRQSSIIGRDGMLKSAEKWLPPISCIKRMATLTSTVIEYMLTAGYHGATLPDFRKTNCFRVTKSGKVMYDFGPDAHKDNFDEWVESLTGTPVKQTAHGTIKRGQKSVLPTSRKRLFQK